jgi:hypothetical protein
MDVTGGGWNVVESQGSLTTTISSCSGFVCRLGGRFSAMGHQTLVGGPPFGPSWRADHPLRCGHSYQPVTYDSADGYVYGSILTQPACIIIP